MDNIIVTRHQGMVAWLRLHGIEGEVKESVKAADVKGRRVFGVLPLHLASEAAEVVTVSMPGLTVEQRKAGGDLTPAEMDAAGATLHAFVVRWVEFVPGLPVEMRDMVHGLLEDAARKNSKSACWNCAENAARILGVPCPADPARPNWPDIEALRRMNENVMDQKLVNAAELRECATPVVDYRQENAMDKEKFDKARADCGRVGHVQSPPRMAVPGDSGRQGAVEHRGPDCRDTTGEPLLKKEQLQYEDLE
jgi:putative CRISPR-associated protein (TIGR02620 family)